eukprot:1455688-Amphidinium_carterae.1
MEMSQEIVDATNYTLSCNIRRRCRRRCRCCCAREVGNSCFVLVGIQTRATVLARRDWKDHLHSYCCGCADWALHGGQSGQAAWQQTMKHPATLP